MKVIIIDRCLICHRKLKDADSIARGIGPKCWSMLQIVSKQQKAKRKARVSLKNKEIKGQITMFENNK
jgi:hypothetical protein